MTPKSLFQRALWKLRSDGLVPFLRSASQSVNKHFFGFESTFARRIQLEWNRLNMKRRYDAPPDPFEVISIDSSEIDSLIWPSFYMNPSYKQGTFVFDGDWDRNSYDHSNFRWDIDLYDSSDRGVLPIDDYWLYQVSGEYLKNGRSWKNVDWCVNDDTYIPARKKNVEKVIGLYDRIKMKGYKSARELENRCGFLPPEYDEIRVNIGRDGSIFLDDGKHRMCAVLHAGDVEKIPVRVIVRHKKWQEIREKFAKHPTTFELDGSVKKHIGHPDLH